MIAMQDDGKLAHFSRSDDLGWVGPSVLSVRAAGLPALIQSHFADPGNLELIVPREGGGLYHLWRPAEAFQVWREAPQPAGSGNWSGLGLVHSTYGNLELVGVCDGNLRHLWQAGAGGAWAEHDIAGHMRGRPALIQSSSGHFGNFEVVAPRSGGGLQHFWRENDAPHVPWHDGATFARGDAGHEKLYDDVSLLQSRFGIFEVIARTSQKCLQHFRFSGERWGGPIDLLLPNGPLYE